MTPSDARDDPYLVAHVRQALVDDAKELGLDVAVDADGALRVSGAVSTPERKAAVAAVAADTVAAHGEARPVVDATDVVVLDPPEPEEPVT